MPELQLDLAAAVAGVSCSAAALAACGARVSPVQWGLTTAFVARIRRMRLGARLDGAIERAGWVESPQRLAVLGAALAGCGAVLGAALSIQLAPLGLAAGTCVVPLALLRAGGRRRARLAGELTPLLELFTLELSAGGSALAALGSVSVQVESELARELRRMLIASQVAGSQGFESRLVEYSERADLPELATLATVLAASRDFGTGAALGVRALASDLRRAQRRELIARSRSALNHVLLPAAATVLLPFLGVLMFPAVSVLERSLG